jgi:hypothetical protein
MHFTFGINGGEERPEMLMSVIVVCQAENYE